MIVKPSEESGYMDSCNVCMCSEKHPKLIQSDAVANKKPDLKYDIKAVVSYPSFRRAIYFLEKEYESVLMSVNDNYLVLSTDGDFLKADIKIGLLSDSVTAEMVGSNKYSLEYLKEFCKGFSEKDMNELELNISSAGDYPLEIHYRTDQWLILAPRVERD